MQDRKMADKLGCLPAIQEHPLIQYHYLNDIADLTPVFLSLSPVLKSLPHKRAHLCHLPQEILGSARPTTHQKVGTGK